MEANGERVIKVEENTRFVVDLDCGDGTALPDDGVDICGFEDDDLPEDNKPIAIALTYSFGTAFDQAVDQARDQRDLDTFGVDDDGEVHVRVFDDDQLLFDGAVGEDQSFEVDNLGERFNSELIFEIFDFSGGPLLQRVEFDASCSQPLAIGDVFGSIALSGATLGGGDGLGSASGDAEPGDGGVSYSIVGGEDAASFRVDPDTGVVSFVRPPDFERPRDADRDNDYALIVRATGDDGAGEDKPLQVRVEDVTSVSGRYFCDENRDGVENRGEPPIEGAKVWLIKKGEGKIDATFTDATGDYAFAGLEAGRYRVKFEGVDGKEFTEANVGDDDRVDSDVTRVTRKGDGLTDGIRLRDGQERKNIDAGATPPDDELVFQVEKDISNMVVYLDCDGAAGDNVTKVKFKGIPSNLKIVTLSQIEEALDRKGFGDCDVYGLTIKNGDNGGNFGPGEGTFYDADLEDDFVTGNKDHAHYEVNIEDIVYDVFNFV